MSVRRTITSRPCARLVCRHRPLAAPPAPRRLSVDVAASSPVEVPGGTAPCCWHTLVSPQPCHCSPAGPREPARWLGEVCPSASSCCARPCSCPGSPAAQPSSHLRPAGGTHFVLGAGHGHPGDRAVPGLVAVWHVERLRGVPRAGSGGSCVPGAWARGVLVPQYKCCGCSRGCRALGAVGAGPPWPQLPPPSTVTAAGAVQHQPSTAGRPWGALPCIPQPISGTAGAARPHQGPPGTLRLPPARLSSPVPPPAACRGLVPSFPAPLAGCAQLPPRLAPSFPAALSGRAACTGAVAGGERLSERRK